ncbi:MAG: DUF1836 domain-containing protein [Tissierellia bacterium]|nr:DUF1836 domain-containing protein [Tissierellia bacterium]
MQLASHDLLDFHLPLWEDLPSEPLRVMEMVTYVNDILEPFYKDKKSLLTKTMVNNYVKWNLIPKPLGRKYERLHIAHALVISILKGVLEISRVHEGIILQVKAMGEPDSYNAFCMVFEKVKLQVLLPIAQGKQSIQFQSSQWKKEEFAMATAIATLLFQMVTLDILNQGGIIPCQK